MSDFAAGAANLVAPKCRAMPPKGGAPGLRQGLSFIQRDMGLPADVDGGLSSKIADPYDDGAFVSGIFDHKLDPQRVAILVI